MENSAANTDLIRSHVITIILRSLEESDKYGYEICREIEVKSEGSYVLKQPTLYSCLKRLESQEFITSYWGEISNGGRRRYYSLTEKGKAYLEHDKQEWEFSRTLINRLLSDKDYDLTSPPPFNPSELRPYTRKMNDFGNNESSATSDNNDFTVAQEESEPIEQVEYVETIPVALELNKEVPQAEIKEEIEVVQSKPESVQESVADISPKVEQLDIFSTLETSSDDEKKESEINYKNAFSKLFDTPVKEDLPPVRSVKNDEPEEKSDSTNLPETISELKKKYYLEGYNLKPHSFSNVAIYYNMNYVYANKLNLLTYWLMYICIAIEIGLLRLIFGTGFGLTDPMYIIALIVGLVVPGVPTVLYFLEPLKRVKADFDFKTSFINRSLLALNLAFVFACMGVFVWQVNLQDLSSMVLPIFIPIILLLNFPLSSVVFYQTYKTKKFHLT